LEKRSEVKELQVLYFILRNLLDKVNFFEKFEIGFDEGGGFETEKKQALDDSKQRSWRGNQP
jgi:hypothetical protein